MSWRAIQGTVAISKSLSGLSHGAERLYWRMLAQTDPWGRLEGDPVKVKGQCLPLVRATPAQISGWLDELQIAGRVRRYRVEDRPFVEFVDFEANQPAEFLRRRGAESKFPHPPKQPCLQVTPVDVGSLPRSASPEGEVEGEEIAPNGAVDEVQLVYDHWRIVRGKTRANYAKPSEERKRKIQARLRDFPASELIRAIDGVALDPWEDRPRHDDLLVIFKSREKVEKFLDLADSPPSNGAVSADQIVARERERLRSVG